MLYFGKNSAKGNPIGFVFTVYMAGIGVNVLGHQFCKAQKQGGASVSVIKKILSSVLPPAGVL